MHGRKDGRTCLLTSHGKSVVFAVAVFLLLVGADGCLFRWVGGAGVEGVFSLLLAREGMICFCWCRGGGGGFAFLLTNATKAIPHQQQKTEPRHQTQHKKHAKGAGCAAVGEGVCCCFVVLHGPFSLAGLPKLQLQSNSKKASTANNNSRSNPTYTQAYEHMHINTYTHT